MPDLKELVVKKLKEIEVSKNTIALCEDIFCWYEEGGPDLIRSNINKRVKEFESKFKKEAKEIKEITPKIKKKRKKKR